MKNKFACLLVLACTAFCASAQLTNEKAIQGTLDRLMLAIQKSDTALARTCFHPEARLQTAFINLRNNVPMVRTESLDSFMTQLARMRENRVQLDEVLSSVEIRIDVPMATVWAPYEFYVDRKLQHKGVNAIQLVKSGGSWLIIQLCDTRKREL